MARDDATFTVRLRREELDAIEQLARDRNLAVNGAIRTLIRAAAGLPVPSWASAANGGKVAA
jgi:hypothetical protein